MFIDLFKIITDLILVCCNLLYTGSLSITGSIKSKELTARKLWGKDFENFTRSVLRKSADEPQIITGEL